MNNLKDCIAFYVDQFYKLDLKKNHKNKLPGNTYFLDDGSILCILRGDGDNRFPYGENGFNFWTYASGYMHANDGLFSPFLRANEGQEPKIAFFVGWEGEKEQKVLSLLPVPALEESNFSKVIRYSIFTNTCTYYITETDEMRFVVRVFVDKTNKMYFSIYINNRSGMKQKLYFSAYLNPYLSNSIYESSEDRWFRKCEYFQKSSQDMGQFVFSINEDISRTESITNFGVMNQSLNLEEGSKLTKVEGTTSRREYVGSVYGSLSNAKALKEGKLSKQVQVTSFTDVAVAGEICHLEIMPEASVRVDIGLSYLTNSHNIEEYKSLISILESDLIDELLMKENDKLVEANKTLAMSFKEGISQEFNSDIINNFLVYLKKQVEFCSLIKGYVQLSPNSLIGIRDVFQALEGLLFYKPKQAREKILESLNYISPTGRCPRQYGLPKTDQALPPMDLRQFIDQGSWIINTVTTYLKFTGDFNLLDEPCGYYEIIDDKKKVIRKSEIVDSVMEHLLKVMDYFISKQDQETGCIKVLYGDWNDALDGLGVSCDGKSEFGNGVSVMASLHVYQNLRDMIELLSLYKGYEKTIENYKKVMDTLERGLKGYAIVSNHVGDKRIVHGWGDKQSYYVGSFHDSDGQSRYGLTSNAFWVLSGLYHKDTTIKEIILECFNHLDSKYGLKTFEPHFLPGATGVGRIYKLPPGTAENGASYIHATAFGIMALFMMGEPIKAWEQLMKIFPFTHKQVSCSPYVMPNSYGYNNNLSIDGESMQDWQTGSSNVVLKTIIRFVFGFQPEYRGITLQPASWIPFTKYEFSIQYHNVLLKVTYINKNTGKRSFYIKGVKQDSIWDENLKTDKLWIDTKDLKNNVDILVED